MPRITVSFSNTFGNEPTQRVPVDGSVTLRTFLDSQGGVPEGAVVRVNRNNVTDLDSQLNDGDVVSVAPAQIKGA